MESEILIIGAGSAGLAAARELSTAGSSVIVLEARERIGGRINTHFDGWPIELGAEFVHGKPPETLAIVERARLKLQTVRIGTGTCTTACSRNQVSSGPRWKT